MQIERTISLQAGDQPHATPYRPKYFLPDDIRSCLHKQIEFHRGMLEDLEHQLEKLPPQAALTPDQWLKESVCSLMPHDTRLTNMLEERGIFLVRDLLNKRPEQLLAIANFGALNLRVIYRALKAAGFKVSDSLVSGI